METSRPTWSSRVWIAAAAIIAVLAAFLLAGGGVGPARTVVPVVIVALALATAAWALARTRQQRQEHERQLIAWAHQRAAQTERLRIARDLHDLASHGLGLITVRAAAARAVPDDRTERTRALADIEQASRETTTELRRLLTVLRSHDLDGGTDPAPLRPPETLADLPELIATANGTGLRVMSDLPDLGDVSPGAQLTLCAIVRETLDNTLRHAGPTTARVHVRREGAALVVTVCDDGPEPGWEPLPGAGHGLTGLRERVSALGGTLQAGPSGPGFTLIARIPDETAP